MILSESYNFIFVHVPKTAGWSVMDTLQPYSRPTRRTLWRSFSRRLPIIESPAFAHFRVHEPAQKMIAKLSRPVWDRFFSFAVVRNPFDQAVSHYEYLKQFRNQKIARRFAAMSFEAYLQDRYNKPFWNHTLFVRMPDQTHFIIDSAGEIAVTRLLRFENLAKDFERLVHDLGLAGTQLLYVNKTKARSDKRPYQSYYNQRTEGMVREIYRRDFRLLDYPDVL